MRNLLTTTLGWITLAGLLATAPQLAGCDTQAKSKLPTPAAKESPTQTGSVPALAKIAEKPSVKASPQLSAQGLPSEKIAKEVKTSPTVDATSVSSAVPPEVKRLVIASDIEEREPLALSEGKIDEPIVAFVELRNTSEVDAKVVVTFIHESGTKVGFIELKVPGESPRYRTWGRTRNIRTPGEWTAVVSTKDGEELARQSFTVAG